MSYHIHAHLHPPRNTKWCQQMSYTSPAGPCSAKLLYSLPGLSVPQAWKLVENASQLAPPAATEPGGFIAAPFPYRTGRRHYLHHGLRLIQPGFTAFRKIVFPFDRKG